MNKCPVRLWIQAIEIVVPIALVLLVTPQIADAAQPTLTVTPTPVNGAYRDGETVGVSIGPNSLFTPNLKVNILECSDPGGTAAHLPTSVAECDGNTIQGGTILIQSDGSFSDSAYTLYSIPNYVLGEQANKQPVCNVTNPCVLYVGQNQEDFTQPKTFSAPFTISTTPIPASSTPTTAAGNSGVGTTTTTPTTTVAGATTSTPTTTAGTNGVGTTSPATSATDPSAVQTTSLADTGPSSLLPWLAASALLLVALGTAGRRRITRVAR
jgi:hypothetical protein